MPPFLIAGVRFVPVSFTPSSSVYAGQLCQGVNVVLLDRNTLDAPEFNGELRIMAVAWTDEAVGSSDQRVTVHEPVVAELDLPRFLAPGDQITVGSSVLVLEVA